MKTKMYLISSYDNKEKLNFEIKIESRKFFEIFAFKSENMIAPYTHRLLGTQKVKLGELLGRPELVDFSVSIVWKLVPETNEEKFEQIKSIIKNARELFTPSDSEISEWMKNTCNQEWSYNRYLEEGKLLMAIETLHVVSQCFYGGPFGDAALNNYLKSARKLLADFVGSQE